MLNSKTSAVLGLSELLIQIKRLDHRSSWCVLWLGPRPLSKWLHVKVEKARRLL